MNFVPAWRHCHAQSTYSTSNTQKHTMSEPTPGSSEPSEDKNEDIVGHDANFLTVYLDRANGRIVSTLGIKVSSLQTLDDTRNGSFHARIAFVTPPSVNNLAANKGGQEKPVSFGRICLGEIFEEPALFLISASFDTKCRIGKPDAMMILLSDVLCAHTISSVTEASACRLVHGDISEDDFRLVGDQVFMMMPGTQLLFRPNGCAASCLLEFGLDKKIAVREVLPAEADTIRERALVMI